MLSLPTRSMAWTWLANMAFYSFLKHVRNSGDQEHCFCFHAPSVLSRTLHGPWPPTSSTMFLSMGTWAPGSQLELGHIWAVPKIIKDTQIAPKFGLRMLTATLTPLWPSWVPFVICSTVEPACCLVSVSSRASHWMNWPLAPVPLNVPHWTCLEKNKLGHQNYPTLQIKKQALVKDLCPQPQESFQNQSAIYREISNGSSSLWKSPLPPQNQANRSWKHWLSR